jgi:hypothetical protein
MAVDEAQKTQSRAFLEKYGVVLTVVHLPVMVVLHLANALVDVMVGFPRGPSPADLHPELLLLSMGLALAALLPPIWLFGTARLAWSTLPASAAERPYAQVVMRRPRVLRGLLGLSFLLNVAMLVPSVLSALDLSGLAPGLFFESLSYPLRFLDFLRHR